MNAELVHHQPGEVAEKIEWARAMAPSNLLPKQFQGNPANLLYAVEYADSLGIERINAITSIHVIEGKPTASADLIAGMVRRAGHRLRISGDDTHAIAELIRADDPEFVYRAEWTLDKARSAGLTGKGVWKNYPGAMLRARAITEVARMGASDALLGVVYTPEEMGAEVDAQGAPKRPSPPVAGTPRAALRQALGTQTPQEAAPSGTTTGAPTPGAVEVEGGGAPTTDAPPPADPITDKTRKHMFALLHDLGIEDPDVQRRGMSQVIGREVESRSSLTEDEGRAIVLELEARKTEGGAA